VIPAIIPATRGGMKQTPDAFKAALSLTWVSHNVVGLRELAGECGRRSLPFGCTLTLMDAWESCRLPDDISYEEWVRYVFDHPVLDPQWWWQQPESGHLQEWDDSADPARTLSFLTQLFEKPEGLIGRFTRAQIDQGLNFLVSNACSGHMFVLSATKLPWAHRRKCFDAMISLYAKLMAVVYQDDLGHLHRSPSDPDRPTGACYMWWENFPYYAGMIHCDRYRINEAVLYVFEQVLTHKAESCLESVLHGLGHWHIYVPELVEPIVRRFLHRSDISRELRRYAEAAAVGRVQ